MKGTVHIIDDDDAVRKALRLLMVSVQLDVATYGSASEFLDRVEDLGTGGGDCLVVDVRMPEMSGLELQQELRRRRLGRLPVILMSGHGDIPMAVRAMKDGALTFLEKPVDEQALIDHVFAAMRPRRNAAEEAQAVLAGYREKLTQRQAEVFDLLVQGLQTKAIAQRLSLSPRTIEVHRAKILERLEMRSFSTLLTTALDRGRAGDTSL